MTNRLTHYWDQPDRPAGFTAREKLSIPAQVKCVTRKPYEGPDVQFPQTLVYEPVPPHEVIHDAPATKGELWPMVVLFALVMGLFGIFGVGVVTIAKWVVG